MPLWLRKLRTWKGIKMKSMTKKSGKKTINPVKPKTKKPALTSEQKKLPDFLREKILKSKAGKTKMYKPLLKPKK